MIWNFPYCGVVASLCRVAVSLLHSCMIRIYCAVSITSMSMYNKVLIISKIRNVRLLVSK